MTEQFNFKKTIFHPKTKELSFDIYETVYKGETCFFYDKDGDFYSSDWCENPLSDCIKDAHDTLNQIYGGTYYEHSRPEYNSDWFLPY
tara:strand:- start:2441 stop:2704 length:264 start_codon:yes stop_codon:yes gene_type:complete